MTFVVGKEYLTNWGVKHNLTCRTVAEDDITPMVASSQGCHFDAETGQSYGGNLIDDLSMPKQEAIEFWQNRIKQIESANHADRIILVQSLLDNMKERIKLMEKREV